MRQRPKKHESNDYIYWTIIIVFLGISAGTFIHDPILHGVIAVLNGWSIDDYQTGLMIGSTSVIAPANASWQSYWIFFMFPALAIFIIVMVITLLRPERVLMVGGIIVMSMNLPSLNPAITGSDAYNAVDMLAKKGFGEGYANLVHYLLFFIILVAWGLYLYIVIENNSKDSRLRIENIYH